MLLDVRPDHLQIVQAILQKHVPQYEVWAFGSRAKWTAKDYSDLDLCIVSVKPLDFRVLGALAEDFSESDLPWKVDVVDWATTSESFRKIIERDKVVVQNRIIQTEAHARPLGEFVSLISGNTPSKENAAYWGGITPWVSAKDMGDFWVEDTEDHLTPAGVDVASRLVPPGTVLLLVRGMTLHKRVPICLTKKPATFNQDVKAVLPKNGISARFLPYLLTGNHDRLHELVDSAGHGTGRLNTDALLSFPVRIPRPEEQESIADFGEAIDERLLLLRHTNATLEAIAQALFKSWFVDFNPVRAKAEGRDPEGIPPEVADLFPSEFEDSPLGEIPKGWESMRLDQACEINPTRRLSKGNVAPYLEMAAIPTQGHRTEAPVSRAFSSGTKFMNGDTLLARITPYLENGKTAFVDFLDEDEIGWGSTEYIVLRPKPPLPGYWAYLLCRHNAFRQFAIQAMVGTSGGQRVEISRLAQFPVYVPSEEIACSFTAIVEPIQARIAANDNEAKTLATLRDTLLPRLMSGKLRIPETIA